MSILEFLLLLLVAGICGSIAQSIVGYSRYGCLVSIAIGFIGALFGKWLSEQMGLPEILMVQLGAHSFPIVWSIVGASLFVAVLALISGQRRRWW